RETKDRFASATEFREALEGHLASIGLGDGDFTFKQWIRNPSAVTVDAMKSIARALTMRAEEQALRGEWDAAMEALSHLSLVAPETEAIPRLMDQFENARDRERRRAAILRFGSVAATLAVLLGAGAATWVKLRPARAPALVAAAAPPAPAAPAPAAATTDTVVARSAAPEPVPARPKTGRVRFDVPPAIRVFWDGALVADHARGLSAQSLGNHRIRLEKNGAPPITQNVRVRAGEPTVIRVR
ncbi:MAG: hypothetical protein ACXVBW_15805, partial [Bdellovibrionota bacterium]